MRIVGISGSLRKASVNTGLLRYCKQVLGNKHGIELDIVPIHELPLFNEDVESKGSAKAVHDFLERCGTKSTDGFIFAACEYNGSISAPLKNALDWGSRGGNLFDDKPCAILGAGGYAGTTRAQGHLRDIAFNLNMKDMRGGFGSGLEIRLQTNDNPAPFDADGNLVHEFWRDMIAEKTIPGFISWIKTLERHDS